jgi:hypothetical protein
LLIDRLPEMGLPRATPISGSRSMNYATGRHTVVHHRYHISYRLDHEVSLQWRPARQGTLIASRAEEFPDIRLAVLATPLACPLAKPRIFSEPPRMASVDICRHYSKRKLGMITPIRPQGQTCDAPNSVQLSACGPETGPPGNCRLKWVDDMHRKALLAERRLNLSARGNANAREKDRRKRAC